MQSISLICVLIIRQIYQAKRYHDEFLTPMACIDEVGHVFLNDFVLLSHSIGSTMGKVLKFFKKVSITLLNYHNVDI